MIIGDEVSIYSRAFSRCGRSIGLGGMDLPLGLARHKGIRDPLFEARAARFRAGPRRPLRLEFNASARDFALLEYVYAQHWRGNLRGAPAPLSGGLAGLFSWRQLAPLLPTYRLPACDAVSVADVVQLLNYLGALHPDATGNLLDLGAHVLLPDPGPRPAALAPAVQSATGPVTDGGVERFAEQFRVLRRVLLDAIPWGRFGTSMCQDAEIANAIASDILGIPVDLRVGGLVLEESVAEVTHLAAGDVDNCAQQRRLGTIISRTVPKVRKREARPGLPNGIVEATRGAVWSVALDAAVNNPLIWARDPNGALPRMRRARPAERQALARLPSTFWVPDASAAPSERRSASASRPN